MKLYKLPYETRAATGWTHMAHCKVADGDLDAVNEVLDICPFPVGGIAGKCVAHTKTGWATITSPILDIGVAASANTNDTLADGIAIATANNTTFGGTNALTFIVNNTASRFITAKQLGSASTATAGEGLILFSLVDTVKMLADPGNI